MQEVVAKVAAEMPGAAQLAVENAVLEAARDLCSRAFVWTRLFTIPMQENQSTYTLPVAAGEWIVKPLHVAGAGSTIVPMDSRMIQTRMHGRAFKWNDSASPATITLIPSDAAVVGEDLEVLVALAPKTLTAMPVNVAARYGDAIKYGACALLAKQQNRPYTSLVMAAEHGRTYRALRAQAYRDSMNGLTAYAPAGILHNAFRTWV
jgi:hypothetical protein